MSHRVQLNILNQSDRYIGEPLYLAGTFNNWSTEHLYLGLIPEQGEYLRFDLEGVPAGELELKLSRGTYASLNSNRHGRLMEPFCIEVEQDVMLELEIEAWRDDFPTSTASEQVQVLDKHFYFPELGVYRKVWIYLPQGYAESQAYYPIIYMHDGQHLFDEATSVGRAGPVEWMVDETIDASGFPSIVVAIDHAPDFKRREQEYMLHPGGDVSAPLGSLYLEDIIHTLIPYVETHYRCLKGPKHTAMVGSSLGGLFSLYAGMFHPEIFGLVAAFSPSIWMDEEPLYRLSKTHYLEEPARYQQQELYFYIGEKENRKTSNRQMWADLELYHQYVKATYSGSSQLHTHPEGKHSALYWQQAFEVFYQYWQQRDYSTL